MKFSDKYVFKDEKFSVGVEETTGKYYVSFPVANSQVDYEEHYEIDRAQYDSCPENLEELRAIVHKSRTRDNDENLFKKPGGMRGSPI